ncbi:MAG TPA: phosphoglucosamine mutase [Saprospiraceae bacterium]|nr:phosphoglucosamine mutase [Saprospiraceae bacterium]
MALIKSISGIRGTIGGGAGDNLTPQDIVECTAAFGAWLLEKGNTPKVVVGRDARISGPLVKQLVINTLLAQGIHVVDLDLSTTPTVEMAVAWEQAGAGIIITASHNPKHWNALKFLNEKGEFIAKAEGEALLAKIEEGSIHYAEVDRLGTLTQKTDYLQQHIQAVLDYPLVNVAAIQSKKLKVVVDGINSSGAVAVPALLERLGCQTILINGEPNGEFAHNPEPLAQHLTQLSATIRTEQADLGISVDPDVDRLAFVCEDGVMFGEEYTLVAVADYVLQHRKGNTVSNLSSTRALRDITEKHGGQYQASAVGEVNVVTKMKEVEAVIGGEGNGGIIVPDFHYGRDALIGIGLFLTHLCQSGQSMTELRASYPDYEMIKDKIQLDPGLDLNALLQKLEEIYRSEDYNTIDGLKINFEKGWVHLRKSNTEPIIRVYAEGPDRATAQQFVDDIKSHI